MDERRQAKRHKSFLRGFVDFDKRLGVMSCVVRDLSDQGARILFSENVAIPSVINLHIPQKDLTLRARVEWRRGEEVGLTFDVVRAAPPDPKELMERVTQLEGEITALRLVLKRLKGEHPNKDDEAAA
jgi:hypothetical protein